MNILKFFLVLVSLFFGLAFLNLNDNACICLAFAGAFASFSK